MSRTGRRVISVMLLAVAVYGAFVPTSITGGSNFYQGNNPDVIPYLTAGYDVQWTGPNQTFENPNTPAADNQRFQLALEWLRANPSLIPELLWVKFVTHWSIDIFPRLNPTEGEAPRPDYQGDAQQQSEGETKQAEMCRTGIERVAGAALTWRVASSPSITGKLMSIRIRSGLSAAAMATACAPSIATNTSKPLRVSRRDSMSRFISLSSTSRIFGIACYPCAAAR